MRSLVVMAPGRLETLTGGYGYDRRMVAGLRDLGWRVEVRELDESFPRPTAAGLAHAARALASVPSNETVLVDGLALGAMPQPLEAEASRLRVVALVHHPLAAETGLPTATSRLLETSERRALAATRLVVVTSRATAATLAGYGVAPERIEVVEPGTDPAPLARGSDDGPLQLLCVATFMARKGHEVLFNALAASTDQQWRLCCVGSLERDPLTTQRLRDLLKRLCLEDRIELRGELGLAALADCYDRADVFVLPTRYEGYGMVVAEALARGLPVVSTTTGAIEELVADGAGLLVPPGDQGALAEALSRVIADPLLRRRLAQGARRARRRLVPWKEASAKLARVLDRVVTDG